MNKKSDASKNSPWDAFDSICIGVRNFFAAIGVFATCVVLGYLSEIWK